MSLFDSASLVVTPNGYKATKLYSVIPSDGTGDMTFARAGNTATRVNASGLITSINADIPRLDYLGGGCPKLLLEPQRTNLLTYSNGFDDASWGKVNTSITANAIASPDGGTNAAKYIANTSNANHSIFKVYSASAGSYTISMFFKKAEYSFGGLRFSSDNDTKRYGVLINLNNGTLADTNSSGSPTGTSYKIDDYGNGWYRLSVTMTNTTGDMYFVGFVSDVANPIWTFSVPTFAGDNVKGIYLYGAQFEAGSYATSYIPTTTAAVTRNADVCTKDSATALIGQTEGVVFSEFNLLNVGDEQQLFYARSGAGVYSNLISIYVGIDKKIYVFVNTSTTQFSYSSPILSTGKHKVSLGYKTNDFVVYIDGVQRSTSNSGSLPSLDRIKLGNYDDGGIRLASLFTTALWKTRLSNTDLAALTSL